MCIKSILGGSLGFAAATHSGCGHYGWVSLELASQLACFTGTPSSVNPQDLTHTVPPFSIAGRWLEAFQHYPEAWAVSKRREWEGEGGGVSCLVGSSAGPATHTDIRLLSPIPCLLCYSHTHMHISTLSLPHPVTHVHTPTPSSFPSPPNHSHTHALSPPLVRRWPTPCSRTRPPHRRCSSSRQKSCRPRSTTTFENWPRSSECICVYVGVWGGGEDCTCV